MRTGLRLAVAGLLFRRSTALIVLVLATVASGAAVLAPLYSRAAEESILRATMQRTDTYNLGVHVAAPDVGGPTADQVRAGKDAAQTAQSVLTHPAFSSPQVSVFVVGLLHPAGGPFRGGVVASRLVERPGLCEHLALSAGRCPTHAGEAVLTRRSLALLGGRIGGSVQFAPENNSAGAAAAPVMTIRVVGSFDPMSVADAYWVGRPYFSSFSPQATAKGLSGENPPTVDPLFTGPGTATTTDRARYDVDVAVAPGQVRLTDVRVLRRQLGQLSATAGERQLIVESNLPSALALADAGRRLVRVAAPLAVIQLVLLSWWALFLVVGSATDERSPELGLGKLRGLTDRQTARFGLAEVLLLLVVAAPVGAVLGYLAVRLAASHVFAPGTSVVISWPVLLTVLGALAGGLVTAVLSSRQVFRRPVSELLRRVPTRTGGRRAGVIEGVVLALAVLGAIQLSAERGSRPSPVALLAPGMVAVAGGLVAARVLVRVARRGNAQALERGRPAAAAGWAAVARRPGTARIASVLAVATCLLLVGVESWTVAHRNRSERAAAETGAAVVLHVRSDPWLLMDVVRSADPRGKYAMAALQVDAQNQAPALLAVDSTRADSVMTWGADADRPDGALSAVLRPNLPAALPVRTGRLSVTVDLTDVQSPSPLHLSARFDDEGFSARVPLGSLSRGQHTYSAPVPTACADGHCRLVGLAVDHAVTDLVPAHAVLLLRSISMLAPNAPAIDLSADLATADAWRPGSASVGGPEVALDPVGPALQMEVDVPGGPYAEAVHGDSPDPLPAVAGTIAAEPPGTDQPATTTGPGASAVHYTADAAAPYIPRLGSDAVLADLPLTLALSPSNGESDSQVWLSRQDPAAERSLRAALTRARITVLSRETRDDLERGYAGNGAVLALRLLFVSGGAAVLVAVGALLVAAYIGRRQRAYDVAALRAVGVSARTAHRLLLYEGVGTVGVALTCGAVAAALASAIVLPALPQFDESPAYAVVRYAPDGSAALLALGALALLLVAVALSVATLQLHSGQADRLREGVR